MTDAACAPLSELGFAVIMGSYVFILATSITGYVMLYRKYAAHTRLLKAALLRHAPAAPACEGGS